MPEKANSTTTTGAETKAGETTETSTTTGATTSGTETQTNTAQETPKTYTQAQLDAEKKKWEKESEKNLKAAEAKAKLSEDERLKTERDEALAQLRMRDTREAVTAEAEKAGVKNPRLFYNAYKEDLETDDKGKITNLKDVLDAAKTESPELFGTPAPTPEGGADAGEGKQTPSGLTKEQVEKMTPEEINTNWEAVSKFLATQK